MAKIPPPRKAKADVPPVTSKPAAEGLKPIQFKIDAKRHQELKIYAAERGISMTQLFHEMYDFYRANHG